MARCRGLFITPETAERHAVPPRTLHEHLDSHSVAVKQCLYYQQLKPDERFFDGEMGDFEANDIIEAARSLGDFDGEQDGTSDQLLPESLLKLQEMDLRVRGESRLGEIMHEWCETARDKYGDTHTC